MKRLTVKKSSAWEYAQALENLEEFQAGKNLSGKKAPKFILIGHLSDGWLRLFLDWSKSGAIDYVVYSYDTPIAWHLNSDHDDHAAELFPRGGWVVPDVKYSPTTSYHQNKIREALPWEWEKGDI